MKHSLTALALALSLGLSTLTGAAPYEVEAAGRDTATATLNLKVSAVRAAMHELLDPAFIKSHVRELRGIIAQSAGYAGAVTISSEDQKNSNVLLRGRVEVDTLRLTVDLKALGADITPSYGMLLAERQQRMDEGFNEIFGTKVNFDQRLQVVPPLSTTPGVTEEIAPAIAVQGPLENEIEAGDILPLRYARPASQSSREGHLAIEEASAPLLDYKEATANRFQDSDAVRVKGKMGLFTMRAPLNPGEYEVRFYGEESGACSARWAFRVTPRELPVMTVPRDVYLPEEKASIHFSALAGFEGGLFVLARPGDEHKRYDEIEHLYRTDDLDHFRQGILEFKMPREEGDYLLMFFDHITTDRDWWLDNNRRSRAVATLPVKVRVPHPASAPRVLAPPQIYSGDRIHLLVSEPARNDERPPRSAYRIVKLPVKGAPLPEPAADAPEPKPGDLAPGEVEVYGRRVDYNQCGSHNSDLLYEPGDYRIDLYEELERGVRVVDSTTVRVLPNELDPDPVIKVDRAELYPGDMLQYAFSAPAALNADAFIAVVPQGTAEEAASALTASGELQRRLNHERGDSAARFVIDLPSGDYEIRMYDRADAGAKLIARDQFRMLDEQSLRAHEQEVQQLLQDFLNSKPPEVKDTSSPGITIPEPPVLHQSTPGVTYAPPIILEEGVDPRKVVRRTREDIAARFYAAPEARKVAVIERDCKLALKEEIQRMKRFDATLGREGKFEEELMSFGQTLLTSFPLGDKLGKLQTAVTVSIDSFKHTVSGLDAVSEGNYTQAAIDAMSLIGKAAVNLCSDEKCFMNMLAKNRKGAANYLATFPEDKFEGIMKQFSTHMSPSVIKQMREARQSLLKDSAALSHVHALANYHFNLDPATFAGTAAGGGLNKEVLKEFVLGALSLNPEVGAIIATAKLGKEAYLSTWDFIYDTSVERTYKNWKTFHEFKDMDFMWRDDNQNMKKLVMEKARNYLLANFDTEIAQKALSKANRDKIRHYKQALIRYGEDARTTQMYKPRLNDFSELEIFDFLDLQFAQWEKTEKENSDYAAHAEKLLDDFYHMAIPFEEKCEQNFNNWLKRGEGSVGAGTRLARGIGEKFYKGCDDEIARFHAYVRTRDRIEADFLKRTEGKPCTSRDDIHKDSKELLCKLVHPKDGAHDYAMWMESALCTCGVNMTVAGDLLLPAGIDALMNLPRWEDYRTVIESIGHSRILNCLCCKAGVTAFSVRCEYDPKPSNASPSCSKLANGICSGGNNGCFRFPMNTSIEALNDCGYQAALLDYYRSGNGNGEGQAQLRMKKQCVGLIKEN